MFARVTSIDVPSNRMEQAIANIQQQVMPVLREQAGSQGMYVLVNRREGKVLGISLWESEEAMQASDAALSPRRDQAAQAAFATHAPVVETYEVVQQP